MRARPLSLSQSLRYGAEAAVFFAFIVPFRLIGVDAASAIGGWLGRTLLYRTGMTRPARDNLRLAFPQMPPGEIEATLKAMWDNLGRTFAEYAHLDKFEVGGRIRVDDAEAGHAAIARGQGVLFLSGHLANWEIMINAGFQLGYDGAYVQRPPNNPIVARYLDRIRRTRGYTDPISKFHGAKRIFSLLRGGKSVLLLIDQKTNEGIAAPFFGRDAMTTPVPAALALRLGCPLVFASNRRTGGAHFTVHIQQPLDFTPSGEATRDVRDLTALINARMEEMVRADPAQWLWIHRRWPTPKDIAGKRA